MGSPVKLQRTRELNKQLLNAIDTSETENSMEHVVNTRILSANTAQPQREEHFYMGSPVKLQRQRELKKQQFLNASETSETENIMEQVVGTRILSANTATPQRAEQFYTPPRKTTAKTRF